MYVKFKILCRGFLLWSSKSFSGFSRLFSCLDIFSQKHLNKSVVTETNTVDLTNSFVQSFILYTIIFYSIVVEVIYKSLITNLAYSVIIEQTIRRIKSKPTGHVFVLYSVTGQESLVRLLVPFGINGSFYCCCFFTIYHRRFTTPYFGVVGYMGLLGMFPFLSLVKNSNKHVSIIELGHQCWIKSIFLFEILTSFF